MKAMATEFKVGLFALAGIAMTVFAIFVLSPNLFRSEERTTYYTRLVDASGLLKKTQVKTNGVTIGNVAKVELDGNMTKVTFEIKSDIRIPVGSTMNVRTVGFLGDKFLEIKRTEATEFIPPGALVPRDTNAMGMEEVMSMLGDIGKDVKKVTESLAAALGTEKGKQSLVNIVDNVEKLTGSARGILEDNRADVRNTIANLEKTTHALRTAIGDKEKALGDIVENIRTFTKSLNEVLDKENKEKVDRILTSLDETMVEVKGASKNINLISAKVEKGEGTIGKLVNDDKAINELEAAIKDIRKVLSPVNNLQVAVDYRGEFRQDKTSQHYFNLQFHTRPDTYYVLGFTDRQDDVKTTTTEQLENDAANNKVKTRETVREEKKIRFNLQFAKRWYAFGVRFGLFETTGGIASDIYVFQDRLRLTMEAFDFAGKDDTVRRFAHLKAYASVLFFNHLSAGVGIDDPTKFEAGTTKVRKKLNPFFTAGLSFNDQDLKALFGTAAVAVGTR